MRRLLVNRRVSRLSHTVIVMAVLTAGCAGSSSSKHSRSPEPISAFSASENERIASVQPEVEDAAKKYDLDTDLINGLIWVESRFQVRAKSPSGAKGLMQLMPATARELATQMGEGRARPYDPEFNIHAGSYYLAKLKKKYDGDERLALAAYHAGPGNVNKWLKRGHFPESSEKYLEKVDQARARFRMDDRQARRHSAKTSESTTPEPTAPALAQTSFAPKENRPLVNEPPQCAPASADGTKDAEARTSGFVPPKLPEPYFQRRVELDRGQQTAVAQAPRGPNPKPSPARPNSSRPHSEPSRPAVEGITSNEMSLPDVRP